MADSALIRAVSEIQSALESLRTERDVAKQRESELQSEIEGLRQAAEEREQSYIADRNALLDANEKLLARTEDLSSTVSKLQAEIMALTRQQNEQFRALAASHAAATPDISRSISRAAARPLTAARAERLESNSVSAGQRPTPAAEPAQTLVEPLAAQSPGSDNFPLNSSSSFVMPIGKASRSASFSSVAATGAAAGGAGAMPQAPASSASAAPASPPRAQPGLDSIDKSMDALRAGAADDIAAYKARLAAKLRGGPGAGQAVGAPLGLGLSSSLGNTAASDSRPVALGASVSSVDSSLEPSLPLSLRQLSMSSSGVGMVNSQAQAREEDRGVGPRSRASSVGREGYSNPARRHSLGGPGSLVQAALDGHIVPAGPERAASQARGRASTADSVDTTASHGQPLSLGGASMKMSPMSDAGPGQGKVVSRTGTLPALTAKDGQARLAARGRAASTNNMATASPQAGPAGTAPKRPSAGASSRNGGSRPASASRDRPAGQAAAGAKEQAPAGPSGYARKPSDGSAALRPPSIPAAVGYASLSASGHGQGQAGASAPAVATSSSSSATAAEPTSQAEVRPEVRAGPYDVDRSGGLDMSQGEQDEVRRQGQGQVLPRSNSALRGAASGQGQGQGAPGSAPAPKAPAQPTMTAPQFFSLLRTHVPKSDLEHLMAGLTLFNSGKVDKGQLLDIANKALGGVQGGQGQDTPDLVAMFKSLILRV